MKARLLFLATFFFFHTLHGQTMRYFEVVTEQLPGSDWRDTAYVVAASDTALLAEITYELSLPIASRRHVNSPLAAGNGGFNHNGSFWYSWHSKPNEWVFAELSTEVCDGRPYTDVESDTAYWIGVVGRYCGWAYHVAREIGAPVAAPEPTEPIADFQPIVPNPAQDETEFFWSQTIDAETTLQVTDAAGRLSITLPLGLMPSGQHSKLFATAALNGGVYFATLRIGPAILVQRFVVAH